MVVFNNIIAGASGAAGAAGFKIDRSLRFNSADSAYLNRTPSSAGNRKTWTWSGWVKRSGSGAASNGIFGAGGMGDTDYFGVSFDTNNKLSIGGNLTSFLISTQVFRDFSAWFHLVVALDTTQGTASNTLKVYVNGSLVTAYDTDNRSSKTSSSVDLGFNRASLQGVGCLINSAGNPASYNNCYLADVFFIDGQALAPTDFGEYDDNNNWNPKAYSGTYGTNGFHLDFSDNSSNAALGLDQRVGVTQDPTGTTYGIVEGGTAASVLDGKTTSYINIRPYSSLTGQGSGVTLDTAITATSSVRIYGSSQGGNYEINGTDYNAAPTFPNHAWTTITGLSFPLTINSFGLDGGSTGAGANLYAIEVDGVVVGGTANNWTVNNLSVAAGSGNDSLIDTPTNYEAASGNNGGNYCTWNPLASQGTLANGNLDLTSGASGTGAVSSFVITSGKWYAEFTNIVGYIGVQDFSKAPTYTSSASSTGSLAIAYYYTGTIYYDGGSASAPSYSTSDLIGIAVDKDANTVSFYKNNVLQQTLTMGSGNVPQIDNLVFIHNGGGAGGSGRTVTANFGQRPFTYTPPTDHLSLCTQNLPDPTIANGADAFYALAYTGTFGGGTVTDSNANFTPDWVWVKRRNTAERNKLYDVVRGTDGTRYKHLESDGNDAEGSGETGITAFVPGGFTSEGGGHINSAGEPFIAWMWDAGTSTITNTDGTHSAQVRANPSTGFSISTHSRTTAASISTWGHGLGAAPEFAILKPYNGAYNWFVWHKSMDYNKRFFLNSSGTPTTYGFNVWSSDSTTLGIYGTIIAGGGTALDCVTYAWAPVEGYSKFGSYTGNGSADGSFVYTGFRPAFLLIRRTDAAASWYIFDSARSTFNVVDDRLQAHSANAENTNAAWNNDFLSNGFKLRTAEIELNNNGSSYIYAAFAEHPFKTSRAR